MNKFIKLIVLPAYFFGFALGDVSHILSDYNQDHISTTTATTEPPPAHPYVFSYSAGRYPGHIDRTHSEVSDGTGVVRGAYSYVDPRQQIRTVEYIADKHGFYPILSHPPQVQQQSEAVQKETERHYALYNAIAARNSHQPTVEEALEILPKETAAVAYAKQKHFTLFDKIAQEHAHIAAEREAERRAYEATSSPNDLLENHEHYQY